MRANLTVAGAAVASAALLSVAQTMPGWQWLTFVGLVPVALTIKPNNVLATFTAFALTYSIYGAVTLSWALQYGSGYGWLILSIPMYLSMFLIIPAACCWAAASRRAAAAGLVVLPAGWMLAELLMSDLLLQCSPILVGQPLADWPLLAQTASIGGPETLSFLALSTNVFLVLLCRQCSAKIRLLALIQGPGLLLVAGVWGFARLHASGGTGPTLMVGVVQPNVDQQQKWEPAARIAMLARLDALIDQILVDEPDLIVLPETAVTGYVRYEGDLADWVKGVVIRTGCPLLFGSLDQDEITSTQSNVAILITPYNTVTTYRKIRLTPVAEYVPQLGPLEGFLIKLRGGRDEFTPGSVPTVFQLAEGVSFSAMICYEEAFADLARDFARGGADLLIGLSNTQAFSRTSLPVQHLRRARLTAIAVGLPMVRCTNDGISCLIDHKGRIHETISSCSGDTVMVSGAAVFPVTLEQSETLYRRFGRAGPYVILLVLTLVVVGLTRLWKTPDGRARRNV